MSVKIKPTEQTRSTKPSPASSILIGAVIIAMFAGGYFYLQKDPEKKRPPKPPAPITVAVSTSTDIPVQVRSIGTVVPVNSVSVKARVGGRVVSIHFSEGQFVKHKDLLFTIDPRPLKAEYAKAQSEVSKQQALIAQAKASILKDKAALAQVRANLNKDKALARLAEINAQRFGALAHAGAVSEVEAERRATDKQSTAAIVEADLAVIENAEAQILADKAVLESSEAQLASARAALENARVQLNFTTINAPISGRTGKILVLKGNNVRSDEEVLVTINQIAPIYVEFAIPDQQFGLLQKYGQATMQAKAILNAQGDSKVGRITFSDNTVDNTTGTVKLKAVFENADSALWPGKYVDVILTLTTLRNTVAVPDQAVETGQHGQFVWVVQNGKTAHMQLVEAGPSVSGLTAIKKGLSAGETVVTDGQIQLSEGSKVQITGPLK